MEGSPQLNVIMCVCVCVCGGEVGEERGTWICMCSVWRWGRVMGYSSLDTSHSIRGWHLAIKHSLSMHVMSCLGWVVTFDLSGNLLGAYVHNAYFVWVLIIPISQYRTPSYEQYVTWEVVLMLAPAWRRTFTTLGWPLSDAIIRGVHPSCKESHQHDSKATKVCTLGWKSYS